MDPEPLCTRCLSLVGPPGVTILEVADIPGAPLRVHIELISASSVARAAVMLPREGSSRRRAR